jgi:hypothetical protein
MPPTTHARLGASKSHRWMACAGTIRMSEGIEETTSEYAKEGTAAHELAEQFLSPAGSPFDRGMEGDIQEAFRRARGAHTDWEVINDEGRFPVTQEMVDAVAVYVNYVRERAVGGELRIEQAFDLAPLNPPEEMYGTADAVVWHEDTRTLEVIDYKHGRGVVVEAVDNSQIRMYALGAVVAIGKRPDTIRTTIVQPRAHHPDGPIRSDEFGWEELVSFKEELFERAHATQDPDAPLVAGDHCRFCPALAICPAQKDHAVVLAQEEFEVLATPGGALPSPEALTLEQLDVVLRGADIVTRWLDAVRAHVANAIERGEEVPGWKLVEGKRNRRWVDEAAVDRYMARKKIKKKSRYKESLVSPAQAEKLLKKIGVELPRKFWEQPEGAPKLVPAEDKRPAIPSSVEQDFEVLAPTQGES